MTDPDFVVAIPARYAASRLPGKPLRLIAGEPLVLHVARRALAAGAREVWVAADDAAHRRRPRRQRRAHRDDLARRTPPAPIASPNARASPAGRTTPSW